MIKPINNKISITVIIVILILITLGISLYGVTYYGLLLGIGLTAAVAVAHGHPIRDVVKMAAAGVDKAKILVIIMALIGLISAAWMLAGVIPAMILMGTNYLTKMNFILATFLVTSFISLILGTAIGSMTTVGIPLMEIAKTMGIPLPIVAGAIVSGAYLGDRSSPMSSSANLTATVTEAKLMKMLKHMMATIIPAFIISILAYYIIGSGYIVDDTGLLRIQETKDVITNSFVIGWFSFVPPILIMIMAFRKIPIVHCMALGLISSIIIILLFRNVTYLEIIKTLIWGYHPQNPDVALLLSGGGLLSMKNVIIVIVSSTALNGLMESLAMLEGIKEWYLRGIKKVGTLILKTSLLSIIMAIITCNQSLSIIIPARFMKDEYDRRNISSNTLGRAISDSGTITVALIPWNVNALATVLILGVSTLDYLPFAFLCLITPLISIAYGYLGFYGYQEKIKAEVMA